ncbi:Uu.00g076770.m01.CDS01 [Anthostomella pinea]|uniref:Uu.00g076770.m01.CDS01 n=1 Tax=Anthostomella pinea TaxID=933095 RepID=A0AAI8VVW0_9PEZI|nr:Uu.00g076770.m01.CDS01 [Anthostomella pinea]
MAGLPPTQPATQRALAIPELLEAILLHVDTRTLLVSAQRVDHPWHTTITTSPLLQRRLFFRADPAATPVPITRVATFDTTERTPGLRLADLLFRMLDWTPRGEQAFTRGGAAAASWRRMLLRQPPLHTTVGFVVGANWGGESAIARCWIVQGGTTNNSNAGAGSEIRMEDVVSAIFDSDHVWTGTAMPRFAAFCVYWAPLPAAVAQLRLTTDDAAGRTMDEWGLVVHFGSGYDRFVL